MPLGGWADGTWSLGLWRHAHLCLKCIFSRVLQGGPSCVMLSVTVEVCTLNMSLFQTVFLSLVLVYLQGFSQSSGPLRPSISKDGSWESSWRSWGHWREHSQAPAIPWTTEEFPECEKAGVWNLGGYPCISSSSTNEMRCSFLSSGFTFCPLHLLPFHVWLGLLPCTLWLLGTGDRHSFISPLLYSVLINNLSLMCLFSPYKIPNHIMWLLHAAQSPFTVLLRISSGHSFDFIIGNTRLCLQGFQCTPGPVLSLCRRKEAPWSITTDNPVEYFVSAFYREGNHGWERASLKVT